MAGQPPLPIGTWGKIANKEVMPGVWRASCRYRGHDGRTRPIERRRATEKKAERALLEALGEELGAARPHLQVSGTPRFEEFCETYLKRIERECVGTTYDRHKTRLDVHLIPAFGGLTVREFSAGRFQALFKELDAQGYSANARRAIRATLSGVMQEVVDLELLAANPVRSMRNIKEPKGRRRKPVAYDAEQLVDFLARLDGDPESARYDMPDFIRFLFGAGCRFGEALAVRWCDLNLTGETVRATDAWGELKKIPPHSLWINGNIVAVKGKGLVRHGGKTFKAERVIPLPEFLVTLLLVRRPEGAAAEEAVFPSGTGGWRHPSNMQKSVRRLRFRIGYPNFTTHIGRKTVATALDEAGHSAREIADLLGHAKPSMTQDVYMGRGRVNPEAASSIDRFHRQG